MKALSRILSVLLALGVFSLPCFVASAEEFNGFEYEVAEGCVTITGYTGTDTAVEIPSAINEMPVTAIAQNAFSYKSIESVTIPGSVRSIGIFAFECCTSLSSVSLGNGIESIGDNAFYKCPITAIEIPGSVWNIGDNAFRNCTSLSSVTLGDGIESIRSSAFQGCPITAIEIPGSVRSIGTDAFYDCSSLSSVTLGDGIESIGSKAFSQCPITAIEIPGSVRSIGEAAFLYCESLSSVTLGDGIESIGGGAFQGCPITAIDIPGSVLSIGDYAFFSCNSLSSVTLGDGIESIGEGAFYQCQITSIEIPGSVKSIGLYAFNECSSLEEVTMSVGLEQIGSYAFYGCNSLGNVYFNGTKYEWNQISIGVDNNPLVDTHIHFSEIGFTTHSLVLSGEIGVVFNVAVPEGFEGELEKVTFSVGKNSVSEMTAADAYNAETGAYEFVCYTGAYNMADEIRPTLIYTEGNEEKSVPGAPYSVKKYIDFVRGNTSGYEQKVVSLVNSLADYGHYSQIYLGRIHGFTCGENEDDRYAAMTTCPTEQYEYTDVLQKVRGYRPQAVTDSEKVSGVSFTLDLESETNLYIDIRVKDGVVPDSASLSGGTVLPVAKKGENVYRVSVNGINALALRDIFTVNVKAGGDTIATVTISPMSYVYKVLSAQEGSLTESDIRNTVCALYYYAKAAEDLIQQGTAPVNPDDPIISPV